MSSNKNILIIDDDNVFIFLSKKLISRHIGECNVFTCSNGKEGIDFIHDRFRKKTPLPHTILLDINMPVFNGWDFLEEFILLPHEYISKSDIFILTSSIREYDKEKSQNYFIVKEFISKPLTPQIIERIVI
jgi:CheY-like chemotaxis protein